MAALDRYEALNAAEQDGAVDAAEWVHVADDLAAELRTLIGTLEYMGSFTTHGTFFPAHPNDGEGGYAYRVRAEWGDVVDRFKKEQG